MSFPLSLVLEWNSLGVWEEGFSLFCQGLSANRSLQRLDLRNNQINHEGAGELAAALKGNSSLQELGKSHSRPCCVGRSTHLGLAERAGCVWLALGREKGFL